MTSLVGIHGIGNNTPGQVPVNAARGLADVWRAALRQGSLAEGADAFDLTVCYYAHRLRRVGRQAGAERLDDLDPQAQTMVRQWLREQDVDLGNPQGKLTGSLRQEVGELARRLNRSRDAVELFVALFFGEVSRYLHGDGLARHLVRTEAANAIAAAAEPRIVVAHSLGSVVAYETLHAYPHLGVDLLVTIGSPLACAPVFDALDPAPQNGRGLRPPGVRRWVNIADRGDIVATPRHGVRDLFDGLDDDLETSIHWADFHLAGNYLKTEALAGVLRGQLD